MRNRFGAFESLWDLLNLFAGVAKKSWGLARTVAGVATALSETLTGAGALSEKKAETCRKYSQRLGKSTRGRVAVATTVFVVLFAVGFVAYDDSVGRARTVSILLDLSIVHLIVFTQV